MAKKKRERPRLIAVEGPVGVGKTTLARALARRMNARLIEEDLEGNPFVKGFYVDPKRTAFQTQIFFLLSRYQQQLTFKQQDLFVRSTVLDYTFEKDRIFAYLTLDPAELALYERIYALLEVRVPRPDLVVFLMARPEVLMDRIRGRSREWERPITLEYLQGLTRAYNDYFFHYDRSPLLVVNTSEIDMVEKEAHLEDVLSAILRMKTGVQHYNPSLLRR